MNRTTRRESLQMAALAALTAYCGRPVASAPRPATPTPPSPPPEALRLWYRYPAREWVEALPVGTGRLGAMVFGGIASERLAINEDTLWAGGPYDPDNPEALAALPEIRRLIFAGDFRKAHELAGAKMMGQPLVQMPYQTAGDVLLSFPEIASTSGYARELCLDTAVARTTFVSAGAKLTREVFASAVDQVIVVRLTSNRPKSLRVDVALRTLLDATVESAEPNTLALRGKNRGSAGVEGALAFEVRARVLASGGSIAAGSGTVAVRDADSVIILVAAATSYQSFRDTGGDPAIVTAQQIGAAASKSWETLFGEHVAEHRRLFHRVSIDLGTSEAASLPTDERVRDAAGTDDPQLAALYFQYGRYLMMACSRPGGQPANLQGLWNDSLAPPWGCKYTININTEMNYWPVEAANLAECALPLVALVRDLAETGARTARVHYGARGWVTHHNTDLWRATAPTDGPQWGLWPTGGAWLCMTLWDHFDYSRDHAYLAEIYPLLKGAAIFFLDTLVEEPEHRWLVTCPSLSPENVHPGGTSICAGPTMDQQILRDLFAHCIEASEILGLDPGLRGELTEASAKLAPCQIGSAGQLQEWLADWDMEAPERHHRHVSHLYGLFPSSQITVEETPLLAAAARRSLEIRGDEATGWGLAWRLNLWARLGEAEHAHSILRALLRPGRTYPNLFDAHPPFQIDGNFGGVSGITEMLMQSHSGVIRFLPALPRAWPAGSVLGLRARGGFGVDIAWRGGQLERATLRGPPGATRIVRYEGQAASLRVPEEGTLRLGWDGTTLQPLRAAGQK